MPGTVWLIANPTAGGGRGARHASAVARAMGTGPLGVRLVLPDSAAGTSAAARAAVTSGAAAVVACGGDGTVHGVLQALVGTEVPLGIVASGSGDDVAASLGFPVDDPREQARFLLSALSDGHVRRVDVAHALAADGTAEAFLGVMSTGFDSSVNERANRMGRFGGQRYTAAMLRELASFRALPYRVEVDGTTHEGHGMLVSVGNGPRFGGGMLVCPTARMDDGLLDVTWLGAISTPQFLRVFPSVYRGEHVRHPAMRVLRARQLLIDAPGQVAYADGERIGPLPVQVQALPDALHVLGRAPLGEDVA